MQLRLQLFRQSFFPIFPIAALLRNRFSLVWDRSIWKCIFFHRQTNDRMGKTLKCIVNPINNKKRNAEVLKSDKKLSKVIKSSTNVSQSHEKCPKSHQTYWKVALKSIQSPEKCPKYPKVLESFHGSLSKVPKNAQKYSKVLERFIEVHPKSRKVSKSHQKCGKVSS